MMDELGRNASEASISEDHAISDLGEEGPRVVRRVGKLGSG